MMNLSVVMSTFNRPNDTLRFLESLEKTVTRRGVQWEVVVVDNNSTDNTAAVVASYINRARYPLRLITEHQQGRSAGINAGIRACSGGYLAFTDDDVLVTPEWVQGIVDYFDKHPEAGCIGGMVKLFNPDDAPITISTSSVYAVVDRTTFTPHNTLIFGCNTAVRRSLLDEIGLFDLELGVGTPTRSGEDVDLVYRVITSSCEVHYVPEIVVHHNHGRRTSKQIKQLRKGYGYGLGAFYAKYFSSSDRQVMRWAYWDLRHTITCHILRALFFVKSREELRRIYYVLVGMLIYRRNHKSLQP